MPLSRSQERVYRAALAADKRFQAQLVRVYKRAAGDMRYQPKKWKDIPLIKAHERFRRLTDKWLKVMRSSQRR